MKRILFFIPLALLACNQPEPVFTDADDVRHAIMQIENAQFRAHVTKTVEADDSQFEREVTMQWLRAHAAKDSTYDMAWMLEDGFIQAGDTSIYIYHLWANEKTYIGADSTKSVDTLDSQNPRNGNGIGNYYAALTLPIALTNSTWWEELESDSLVDVKWEHLLPTRSTPEQFILTRTAIQDSTAEDFHPQSLNSLKWIFQAPNGLPVRYEQSWYEGDIMYGSDMTIEWTWDDVNQPAIVNTIADWTAPDWIKEPEPVDSEVAGGGGSENWFEEAMASLPAIGAEAPALAGLNLKGEPVSLEALTGQLVYVDFWYIGCGPCMSALPHLAGMQEEFGPEGFTVLGVNHHQKAKTVQRYLNRRELDVPQMMLDSLPKEYPVAAYPTWCLVGRDGRIIDRNIGYSEDTGAFLDSLVQVNL
ncbi:MAG: TlpA disulfide reductase family protein [Flavobacteriales bacterium]|nr:TlpA disulfide reductase family protein [Flavobacteriales bacterium]